MDGANCPAAVTSAYGKGFYINRRRIDIYKMSL